ncbi:MAG: NifU N-terminal domain-containing protein [Gemmatimonadota bacterium]|nr:MAG: NifU N-terminal domain-containing protein [Gemmatimonadota bacterium]
MSDPSITVQGTPNPNAAKFTVDRTLVEGGTSRSYFDPAAAAGDRLARTLFEIDGVESLLVAEDFVTVTKAESADWEALVPQIENAIKEALS